MPPEVLVWRANQSRDPYQALTTSWDGIDASKVSTAQVENPIVASKTQAASPQRPLILSHTSFKSKPVWRSSGLLFSPRSPSLTSHSWLAGPALVEVDGCMASSSDEMTPGFLDLEWPPEMRATLSPSGDPMNEGFFPDKK